MLAQGRMIFLLTSAGVVSSQQVESPTVRQKNVQNTEYDDRYRVNRNMEIYNYWEK